MSDEGQVLNTETSVEEETDTILSSEEVDNNTDEEIISAMDENVDKVEEYFKLKDVVRTLRNDLKDIKLQMPENEELERLVKRVKELKEKVRDEENVKLLTEKIQVTKERMDLMKELIRIELLESAREEVKKNGRKLKIVNILREMKDQEEKKKGGKKFFKR